MVGASLASPWGADASPSDKVPVQQAPAGIATCVACHGATGEGNASGVPALAGQNVEYLAHALTMFKAGTRASPVMQPVAGRLGDDEIRQLASYFANLHAQRAPAPEPPAELLAAGKRLAEIGAAATSTPACFSCHGDAGYGVGSRYPGLAGQPRAFLVDRLHEFQARAKGKPPAPGTMTEVAARLDDAQILQAAAYLSSLPPR